MVNEFKIKQEICEVGRKIYAKGFAAANDGNISYRLNDKEVLCTPTLVSKGFLKPDDICTVTMDGKQIAGRRKRTSEVLLHCEIYKRNPDVRAVVHCHPPYATAFSVAGEIIPTCVLPEFEVFLGPVPTTDYETPGAQNFADTIIPHIKTAKIAVLKNHGTVAWAESVDRAYWWTEILDAYCKILLIAKQVGNVERISDPKVKELLDLKSRFGITDDPRGSGAGMTNADLCINTDFGRGFSSPSSCGCTPGGNHGGSANAAANLGLSEADVEKMVQEITNRIMGSMK
ncbi:MAG: class II aldolase/adducin family protein [Phycisphaerae bacterium]|nr:class II aldolase/adducin family protein [Phycisphaerae bacterium]